MATNKNHLGDKEHQMEVKWIDKILKINRFIAKSIAKQCYK